MYSYAENVITLGALDMVEWFRSLYISRLGTDKCTGVTEQ